MRNVEPFEAWWARNHPADWWRKTRRGKPLPDRDRMRVWKIAKAAYERKEYAMDT